MKKKNEKLFFILIAFVLIVVVSLVIYNLSLFFYGSRYSKALQDENSLDKCKTPPGYTDADWKEHMSHHPDRYKECLT